MQEHKHGDIGANKRYHANGGGRKGSKVRLYHDDALRWTLYRKCSSLKTAIIMAAGPVVTDTNSDAIRITKLTSGEHILALASLFKGA